MDSFAYDSAGNRTDHGGTYGPGNRIQAFDNCTYSTDEDGNVTQRSCAGETVTIAWNADNRPNRFTVNGTTIDLFYDPAGRLVQRSANGARQALFLWDGDNLLAELDGSGEKRAEYSYYPGQDNPHAVIKGSTPYYAHTDGLGNVVAVTNEAQQLAWTYEYDVWGQPTDGGGPDTLDNRARYKGALWLGPEVEFYYMRNRWYEPKTGRFLSEDPIGLEGGLNLYAFAGNDPVNQRDPTGLRCEIYKYELIDGDWVHTETREAGEGELFRRPNDDVYRCEGGEWKLLGGDEAGRIGSSASPSCGLQRSMFVATAIIDAATVVSLVTPVGLAAQGVRWLVVGGAKQLVTGVARLQGGRIGLNAVALPVRRAALAGGAIEVLAGRVTLWAAGHLAADPISLRAVEGAGLQSLASGHVGDFVPGWATGRAWARLKSCKGGQ